MNSLGIELCRADGWILNTSDIHESCDNQLKMLGNSAGAFRLCLPLDPNFLDCPWKLFCPTYPHLQSYLQCLIFTPLATATTYGTLMWRVSSNYCTYVAGWVLSMTDLVNFSLVQLQNGFTQVEWFVKPYGLI